MSGVFLLTNTSKKASGKRYLVFLILFSCMFSQAEQVLSLKDAIELSLSGDPTLQQISNQKAALEELSVAKSRLPDLKVRGGIMNFPVESGGFRTEGMSQYLLNLRQDFPAMGSRRAQQLSLLAQAEQKEFEAQARKREILREVRLAWLHVIFELRALELERSSRDYIQSLVEVTRSLYSVGSRQQQDVFLAQLELSRIDDQIEQKLAQIERSKAEVAMLTGVDAFSPDTTEFPDWNIDPETLDAESSLSAHPTLLVYDAMLSADDFAIDLARSAYKPNLAIDVSYGLRDGVLASGTSRSDFLSSSVSLSLPFLNNNKQDSNLKAAQADRRANQSAKDRQQRILKRDRNQARSDWQSVATRVVNYETTIVPNAASYVEATLQAYKNETGEFAEVMRSHKDFIDTQLAKERLLLTRLQTVAQVDYLVQTL